MEKETEHFALLLQSIKQFGSEKKIMTDLSLLDEIEKMQQLLEILDRDWSVGIKEIHQASSHFILNTKYSRQEMREVCEAVQHWTEFAVQIAQYADFIRQTCHLYTQLFCYLDRKD